MSEPIWNPLQVEERIAGISNRIAKSVTVCSSAYREFMRCDLDYDRAYAHAYMAHDGPAHEKKYAAELATYDERQARDVADVAYRHADRLARALEAELRAMQSIGASIRMQYGVAGRGEGA